MLHLANRCWCYCFKSGSGINCVWIVSVNKSDLMSHSIGIAIESTLNPVNSFLFIRMRNVRLIINYKPHLRQFVQSLELIDLAPVYVVRWLILLVSQIYLLCIHLYKIGSHISNTNRLVDSRWTFTLNLIAIVYSMRVVPTSYSVLCTYWMMRKNLDFFEFFFVIGTHLFFDEIRSSILFCAASLF